MPYLIVLSVLCAVNGAYLTYSGLTSRPHETYLGILLVGIVPLVVAPLVFRFRRRIASAEQPRSRLSALRWFLVMPAAAFAYFEAVGFTLTVFGRIPSPVGRWFGVAGIALLGPWLAIALAAVTAPHSRRRVSVGLAALCLLTLVVTHVVWSTRNATFALQGHLEFLALYCGVVLGGLAPRVA